MRRKPTFAVLPPPEQRAGTNGVHRQGVRVDRRRGRHRRHFSRSSDARKSVTPSSAMSRAATDSADAETAIHFPSAQR